MRKSILIALNDSLSSKAVVEYVCTLTDCPQEWHVTLLHLFKKPAATEDLMGKKFAEEQPARFLNMLNKAKDRLVEGGYHPDHIEVRLVKEKYPTVADGIIDQFKKEAYDMVVIGRKRMSKAEEFVLGDVSVKLVRALQGTAVLVVKPK